MANIKQVIVVRKDLNMRKGKIASQVAHAAMKVFFDKMTIFPDSVTHKMKAVIYDLTSEMEKWMSGAFTKVVVSVNSEDEIYDLAKKSEELDIPHAVIIDNGFTEFNGRKTTTCIAIGPDDSEKIDQLTGKLPLI